MAANAANFTTISDARPSIFDVIAQKSLEVTLQPAARKIAQFLADSSPRYLGWIVDHYDEVFLVLNGFLEYYYLKQHGASFSEYFYGMRRVSVHKHGRFSNHKEKLSWLILVVLPYVANKIEHKMMSLRLEEAEIGFHNDSRGRLKKLLLNLNSAAQFSWGTWMLINYLRYMSDKTDSQLPSLQIVNLMLVYTNEEDNAQSFWTALFKGQLSFSELSTGLLQHAVRSVLEISAFFVQFLQAWNTEKANYNITALPTVPPPPLYPDADQYRDKCPICLQVWKIPTVLPVSGYVFCFSCIMRYLRENHKCPVTNYPARPLDIVRMYDSDNNS